VGPQNHVLDEGADPKGKGQFSAVVRASIGNLRCSGRCKRDHSIANNVMQKGLFNMPGKHK